MYCVYISVFMWLFARMYGFVCMFYVRGLPLVWSEDEGKHGYLTSVTLDCELFFFCVYILFYAFSS